MADSHVDRDLLGRAAAGNEAAFAELIAPYQRVIFRHCYRMLGSGADAEDATQDALLRAWRGLRGYDGSGAFGGWLHRIATNVCLDALRGKQGRLDPAAEGRPATPGASLAAADPGRLWVEPVSDADLAGSADPQDEVVRREEISLAFVAALQLLAPRQRAALLLADVLGFSHAEVAEVLEVTPAAVNSLLSRARQVVREKPWRQPLDRSDERVRSLLARYVRAWQLADIGTFIELVADDIRFSMPPMTAWFEGRDAVAGFVEEAIFAAARPHGIPLRAGWCNGQPAFAVYQPDPSGRLTAGGLQVLELDDRDGTPVISAIVSYRDPELAGRCGLPPVIEQA